MRPSSVKASPEELVGPISDFVFTRSLADHSDSPAYGAAGVLQQPRPVKRALGKKERQEIALAGIACLGLELGMYSVASIVGRTDTDSCSAELFAEAMSSLEDDKRGRELLDHIKLTRYGSDLVVYTPFTTQMATMAKCQLTLALPVVCPVDIRGCLSQVEIVNLAGPVNVSLAYGGVSLFETRGDVNAQTGPEGRIVFSGCQGRVALISGGEINLKLTNQLFQGRLEATTREEPIRVLIPTSFQTGFQAEAPNVICRIDTESEIERTQQDGRTLVHFGSGEPAIRLRSFCGPIVIDNITL